MLTFKHNEEESTTIFYKPDFLTKQYSEKILSNLEQLEKWYGGEYFENNVKRIQRWYHIQGKEFCKKWNKDFERWKSCIYEDWLLELQRDIENKINEMKLFNEKVSFNSLLINKYRNGGEFIGKHSDSEEIFGKDPIIVSLSFGDSRIFRLTKKGDNKSVHEFKLEQGSLLIMAGSCQRYFFHEVLKSKSIIPRYNLTFRNHKID